MFVVWWIAADHCIVDLLLSVSVREFSKSVNI